MRPLLTIVCVLSAMMAVTLTSCSDAETEKKLEGTWVCEYTEKEDGMTLRGKETVTYSLPDHKFDAELKYVITYPVYMDMATIRYSGTWSATKNELTEEVDKNSISWKLNNMMSSSEKRELKEDMLKEMEESDFTQRVRITSEITDSFDAKDDEGERYHYVRVNK